MEQYKGQILPRIGDDSVRLPITLDYNAGRAESTKSRIIWASAALAVTLVIDIGLLFSSSAFFTKILIIAIFTYVSTFIIRFALLKEHKYRAEMKERIANDYKLNMTDFWGIHEIRDDICYFKNGQIGRFVMLEKGSTVGTAEEDRFEHYEAISDAYNNMGVKSMRVNHIDLMDMVGRDDRIRKAYINMLSYDHGGVRNVLEHIFSNLQRKAESTVTSYDVYLFMYKGNELAFMQDLKKVIACLLAANYSNYIFLDKKRIQVITAALFNLNSFSVNEASAEAFKGGKGIDLKIRPIRLELDGVVVEEINKTREEEKTERKQKAELEKLKRQEVAKRQAKKKESRKKGVEPSSTTTLSSTGVFDLDAEESTGILGDEDDFFGTGYLSAEPAPLSNEQQESFDLDDGDLDFEELGEDDLDFEDEEDNAKSAYKVPAEEFFDL